MGWSELREFNFDPRQNIFLFFERGNPWASTLALIVVFGLTLWFCALAVDPDWHPGRLRGRGVWIIALILLMPIAMRVVVLGVCTGLFAESTYRAIWRCFDGMPDFVIGPSGVADLNPWNPRALWWYEVREIRRYVTDKTLFGMGGKPLYLQFVARRQRPRWLPGWLWDMLPSHVVERTIDIAPRSVGWTHRGFVWLIERYAGNVAIVDRPLRT